MADAPMTAAATGRRKSSVARVSLRPGTGNFIINGRTLDDYFCRHALRMQVHQPFEAVNSTGQYDVVANIKGGGTTGQAGALRHGIARALEKIDAGLRVSLKRGGMLTRDSRKKERKKYGQKGARARFQFSKR